MTSGEITYLDSMENEEYSDDADVEEFKEIAGNRFALIVVAKNRNTNERPWTLDDIAHWCFYTQPITEEIKADLRRELEEDPEHGLQCVIDQADIIEAPDYLIDFLENEIY